MLVFRTPSNSRNWASDQQRLSSAVFIGDAVTIKNIRNFSYISRSVYSPHYYDKTFSLEDIDSVDYVVEPLASVAAAHTFLSFGFKNGDRVAISIEIRKETEEEFNPLLGLLNEYELMYVVIDERDAFKLRVIHRDNRLYVYPTTAVPEQVRALFVDMLARVNALTSAPEFYNTFTNSCATNIADHINAMSPGQVPWDWRLLFPKESDAFAYDLGFIDNTIPLEEARKRYLINDAVEKHAVDPDFSVRIREGR